MNFNEFLAHAKKVNGVPLDTLAKEVGAHMVLYPETDMKVVMTVNVSTDSVLEARIAKAKGFNTVLTSVNPKDDIRLLREVHGLTAVQCPAQLAKLATTNN